MRTITQAELIKLIRNTKGATFATIALCTEPKMLKNSRTQKTLDDQKIPNPYLGDVMKISKYNVVVNFNYENSVNNQRGREHKNKDFKAQSIWGQHETRSLINKDDVYYLHVKLEKKLSSNYFSIEDHSSIGESVLEEYFPKKYESQTQNVQKEVICIRPKIKNIHEITINKETYKITD